MSNLVGRTAIVTGAARGLGRTYAQKLMEAGMNVVVADRADVAETLDLMYGAGKTLGVSVDVADFKSVSAMAEKALAAFGRVDVLVNNVGDMASDQKSWRELDERVVDHTLAVDIKGTMFMMHEVGSRMLDSGQGGVIVNIGSQVVIAGSPRAPQYAAAKYGVIGLTKSYARALAPLVRVNTLGAAFMETEALKNRHDWKSGRREEVLRQTPLGRIAQPEDMVGPVLFLAADDSRHMTGQFLLANGGLAMVGA